MEEILHQLRLVVYPMIYKVLAPSQVVIAGFLNHQQYVSFKEGIGHRAILPQSQFRTSWPSAHCSFGSWGSLSWNFWNVETGQGIILVKKKPEMEMRYDCILIWIPPNSSEGYRNNLKPTDPCMVYYSPTFAIQVSWLYQSHESYGHNNLLHVACWNPIDLPSQRHRMGELLEWSRPDNPFPNQTLRLITEPPTSNFK